AIGSILKAFDDKIDLNRCMNATLEAMARTLFQAWFVDFEPVRAKKQREQTPALALDVGELFPDSFEESSVGKVPRGWTVRTIGELAERVAMGPFGSNIKTDNFVPEGVPVIRGGNLTDGFIDDEFVFLTDAKADELKNSVAYPGDVVI